MKMSTHARQVARTTGDAAPTVESLVFTIERITGEVAFELRYPSGVGPDGVITGLDDIIALAMLLKAKLEESCDG